MELKIVVNVVGQIFFSSIHPFLKLEHTMTTWSTPMYTLSLNRDSLVKDTSGRQRIDLSCLPENFLWVFEALN